MEGLLKVIKKLNYILLYQIVLYSKENTKILLFILKL